MKAYELLDSPEKWIQNLAACAADGTSCDSDEPVAARWCLFGAINRCYQAEALVEYNERWTRLRDRLGCGPITWNDTPGRTYDEVITVLKELDI